MADLWFSIYVKKLFHGRRNKAKLTDLHFVGIPPLSRNRKDAEFCFVSYKTERVSLCISKAGVGCVQSPKLKSRYEARNRFQEPSLELSSQAIILYRAGSYTRFLAPHKFRTRVVFEGCKQRVLNDL